MTWAELSVDGWRLLQARRARKEGAPPPEALRFVVSREDLRELMVDDGTPGWAPSPAGVLRLFGVDVNAGPVGRGVLTLVDR